MARHGDERPVEVVRHGFDEARLAAPSRALEQHGQALAVGGLEDSFLVTDGDVERPSWTRSSIPLSISSRSRVRSLRWELRCWPSAERSAAANSGAINAGRCVAGGHSRVGRGTEDAPERGAVGVGADAEAQAPDAPTSGLEERPSGVGLAVAPS